ncbi:hypothetical protein IAD21_05593 [Abditibacteriota bacterium]|nr:hypothetical protein IAD21_05593 [Abditibacteriota bacterium]
MQKLTLCLALTLGLLATPLTAQTVPAPSTPAGWHPQLLFGTVNFNEQLANSPQQWQKTAARADGMLLHIHFWVRHMSTPSNNKVENAEAIERAIAPSLQGKKNIVELTYHIRDTGSSPEEIGRDHAAQVEKLEKDIGVSIDAVNVDWILSGFEVQMGEMPRQDNETDDVYFTRILNGVLAKSARYVAAFRAEGRTEKLIAVFPPIYMDEGPWTNARKQKRPGLTTSRVLNGLFDAGFDGFTADSPYFVLSNPTYRVAGYYDALRSIEWTCHQRGKSFGIILNGDNQEVGVAYDVQFGKTSLEALGLVRDAGLRPDQLVLESWYKGPFTLVPEDQAGTFSNTVMQVAAKLDADK